MATLKLFNDMWLNGENEINTLQKYILYRHPVAKKHLRSIGNLSYWKGDTYLNFFIIQGVTFARGYQRRGELMKAVMGIKQILNCSISYESNVSVVFRLILPTWLTWPYADTTV